MVNKCARDSPKSDNNEELSKNDAAFSVNCGSTIVVIGYGNEMFNLRCTSHAPTESTAAGSYFRSPVLSSPVMARHSSQLMEFARFGAEHRYRELQDELNGLVASFPHLRALKAAPTLQTKATPADGSNRRTRTMSAAARRRISEAQKRRWAAQKGQDEQQAAPAEMKASPAQPNAATTASPRKGSMSAAARRAVSERMKKYWADRRKKKASRRNA